MTFEEFFAKKKIDLNKLREAESGLYSEFKSHFEQMGEKSFDHTKKFWFNKLRRLYHLDQPERAVTQVDTRIASQAEPLNSPSIEQSPAEKPATPRATAPGFKPRNIAAKPGEDKPEQKEATESSAPPVKKGGFKPRNVKPLASENAADANTPESRPGEVESADAPAQPGAGANELPKPGLKPKFKPRNIPTTATKPEAPDAKPVEQQEPQAGEGAASEQESAKQVYKPKFKMKNIPQKPAESPEEKTETTARENSNDAPPQEERPQPAYKPRFKMKNVPPAQKEEQANGQDAGAETVAVQPEEIQTTEPDQASRAEEKPEKPLTNPTEATDEQRPAYKPRFNMRNIKPKGGE